MSMTHVAGVIDLQVFCEVLDLLVLVPLGSFSSCRRASGPNSYNDIKVGERVDDAAEPPSFVFDFCTFLGGKAKFYICCGQQGFMIDSRIIHTPGHCRQQVLSLPWFE